MAEEDWEEEPFKKRKEKKKDREIIGDIIPNSVLGEFSLQWMREPGGGVGGEDHCFICMCVCVCVGETV